MEPLSVAMHAVSNVAQLRAEKAVAVFGCGPVGLLCMVGVIIYELLARFDSAYMQAVAKALGASRIIAIDIVPSRVEFARQVRN